MPRKPNWKILADMDDFTSAYVECALWAETDNSDDSGGDPLDKNYSPEDIHSATLREIVRECADFQEHNRDLYRELWTDEQAGHDFWLTRQGHGAGFWDRGHGEIGDKLTEASKAYGEVYLHVWRGKVRAD